MHPRGWVPNKLTVTAQLPEDGELAVINWEIARQPLNWLTVLTMGLFFVVLISIVSPEASKKDK